MNMSNTYAVFNSADKNAGITLSGGDLIATGASGTQKGVRANIGKSSGVWTFEGTFNASYNNIFFGFGDNAFSLSSAVGNSANSCSFALSSFYSTGITKIGVAPAVSASTFMITLDLTNGKGWICKNNVWANSGLSGAFDVDNPSFTWSGGLMLYPAVSILTAALTLNTGASAFANTVPIISNSGWFTPPTSIPVILNTRRDL